MAIGEQIVETCRRTPAFAGVRRAGAPWPLDAVQIDDPERVCASTRMKCRAAWPSAS